MKYSIIIPHYNIPHLLKRWLSSIPIRDDVQTIVVDDCSNEAALSELRAMQIAFLTVQFYYLDENRGGGHARNVGLLHATGEYVLFLDADDYYHDCINVFLDAYKEETADVIFFNADSIAPITLNTSDRANKLNSFIDDYFSREASDSMSLRYLFCGLNCKMVRKSLIDYHRVRFDELPAIDDVTFSYLVGYYAKTISISKGAEKQRLALA